MLKLVGRLLTRAAEALDRSLIMVPDVDEADAVLTSRHLDAFHSVIASNWKFRSGGDFQCTADQSVRERLKTH